MSDKEKDPNQEDENLNQEGQESDDSFGLPDLEYQPLDQEEEESSDDSMSDDADSDDTDSDDTIEDTEVPDDEVAQKPAYMEDNDSKAPLIIGLLVTVVIVVGGLGYFLGWYDGLMSEPEPVVVEQPEPEPDPEPEPEPEPEPVVEEPAEPEITPGEVRTITERTQRYYVIISSSIDGDLAMDLAKELAEQGNSPSIIPPYGDKIYYRLAIDDRGSFQEAQTRADELKADHGDGLWVLKY